MAIAAGDYHSLGLKSDGTVVAIGDNGDGQCNVSGWKLFNSIDNLGAESRLARRERDSLKEELANLRGLLFTGRRRREIEARLSEIEAELRRLR